MGWKEERKRLTELDQEARRKEYFCEDDFIPLSDIPVWAEEVKPHVKEKDKEEITKNLLEDFELKEDPEVDLTKKISIFVGDITKLEIDCIVNAANNSLLGGGGVDGAIHRAAGPLLLAENKTLGGCETGEAKLSGGYLLPAKYVVSTVGPRGEKPEILTKAYKSCLELMLENNLRSIAFPCISTGVYGYPNHNACTVAMKTVRRFLEENHDKVDRVIFCLFLQKDVTLYRERLPIVFPMPSKL